MLLTAMHDNPNQGFWQANAKNNPPAIIKESTVSPDKRMILFCMCFENQSGSVAQILTVAGTKLMQISSRQLFIISVSRSLGVCKWGQWDSIIKKRGTKLIYLLFEVLGNHVVQIQNEAHVGNVSVKLHSSYYFRKFLSFEKQGIKLTLFICMPCFF